MFDSSYFKFDLNFGAKKLVSSAIEENSDKGKPFQKNLENEYFIFLNFILIRFFTVVQVVGILWHLQKFL
jgi:hypothetical protein